jgi:hypothetical protein
MNYYLTEDKFKAVAEEIKRHFHNADVESILRKHASQDGVVDATFKGHAEQLAACAAEYLATRKSDHREELVEAIQAYGDYRDSLPTPPSRISRIQLRLGKNV